MIKFFSIENRHIHLEAPNTRVKYIARDRLSNRFLIQLIGGWASFSFLFHFSVRATQSSRSTNAYDRIVGPWESLVELVPFIVITLGLAVSSFRLKDLPKTARILSWTLVLGTVALCAALGSEWFL